MIRRFSVAVVSLLLLAAPHIAAVGAQAPPGQSEFVPVNGLPESEKLPAAPLLVVAYAVFLVLMVFYVWTVWRRLDKVETEMRALEQRTAKGR
jgi:membrane protein implicated in regulation of membrane protease activity